MELLLAFVGLGFLIMAYTFLRLAFAVTKIADHMAPGPPGPDAFPAPIEIPALIQNLIDMESERWAKEDLEGQARTLYGEHQDWNKVHATLLEEVGDPFDAANRAWKAEPEVTEADGEPIAEGF